MLPIGQCNGLAPNNIYLETNTNTSFPYRNESKSSGGPGGIDVDGNSDTVSSGGNATGAGFIVTIPISSLLLMLGGVIGALSSSGIIIL